jgi:hypothetical protein
MRKRDGMPFTGIVNKFLKESHEMTLFTKEQALFLKNNDFYFLECLAAIIQQRYLRYSSETPTFYQN